MGLGSSEQKPALRFRNWTAQFSGRLQPFRNHDFRVGECLLPRCAVWSAACQFRHLGDECAIGPRENVMAALYPPGNAERDQHAANAEPNLGGKAEAMPDGGYSFPITAFVNSLVPATPPTSRVR